MPALRKRLIRRPELYLGVLVLAIALYQHYGHYLTHSIGVRCRYEPTCSNYSIAVVKRYGVEVGLILTWRRLSSCTGSVPLGRVDEVP